MSDIEIEAGESKQIVEPDTKLPRLTPAERQAIVDATIKRRSGSFGKEVWLHNKATMMTSLQLADHGVPTVLIHSFDKDMNCTCEAYRHKMAEQDGVVFVPCVSPGKHPIPPQWEKKGTTDRDLIRNRYKDAYRRQNIGIVCTAESRIVLIDSDGDLGEASSAQLELEGVLPPTITAVSGSRKGSHRYYRVPEGWVIKNSVKVLADGVDVRGDRGMGVAPGSLHKSGNLYTWRDGLSPDDVEVADAPVTLLRRLWFATVERRNMAAPDGSKYEDSGLPEQATAAPSTKAGGDTAYDAAAAAEGIVIGAKGYKGHIATIGHGEGLRGFNDPIYGAALSWFGTHGYDESYVPALRTMIMERIEVAPEETPGHREAYMVDGGKADTQIENARQAIMGKPDSKAHRKALPEPTAEPLTSVDTDIAEITDESEMVPFMRRLYVTAGLDDEQQRRAVRELGRQVNGVDDGLRSVKELWEDVSWGLRFQRPRTTDYDTAMAYMTSRYVGVRWGKNYVYVDMSRPNVLPVSGASLVEEYGNTKIILPASAKRPKAVVLENWFDVWSGLEDKKSYDGVVFRPRGPVAPCNLNLFQNKTVKAVKGDWSLMRRHLLMNVCNGNPYRFAYLIATFASWVQRPDVKNGVCVVLRGLKGSGKSIVAEWLCELFPYNSGVVSNPDSLFGTFRASTCYQIITCIEEGFWAGDKKRESQFKHMITGAKQDLHPKGVDAIEIDDFHHFILTTNSQWTVPASQDERRFYILDVAPTHMQDTKYFGAIVRQMENGGLEAMRYDLLNMVIPDWVDLRKPPHTKALAEQVELSAEHHVRWYHDVLRNGHMVVPKDSEMGQETGEVYYWPDADEQVNVLDVLTRDAQLSYQAYVARHRGGGGPISDTALGMYLAKLGVEKKRATTAVMGKRPSNYVFPGLETARAAFTKETGIRFDEVDVTVLPEVLKPRMVVVDGKAQNAGSPILGAWLLWGRGVVRPH